MNTLLSAAGRTFLRTFAAALLVFAPGILAAPDVGTARALGVAALLASLAAGIRTFQAYIPRLNVSHYVGERTGKYADAFLQGFTASLVATLTGVLTAPDLGTARSLGVAAVVGALNAGVRAVQSAFQQGEGPVAGSGIPEPPAAKPVAPVAPAIPPG